MLIKYYGSDYTARIVIRGPFWQSGSINRLVKAIDHAVPVIVRIRPHWSGLFLTAEISGQSRYILRAYKHLMASFND
ncbi:hypothetical protein KCT17_003670 [Escherichia coli]|nr:hypothetical protein [Escherichia coli]